MDKNAFMDYVQNQVREIYGQKVIDEFKFARRNQRPVVRATNNPLGMENPDHVTVGIRSQIYSVSPMYLQVEWGVECVIDAPQSVDELTPENVAKLCRIRGYVAVGGNLETVGQYWKVVDERVITSDFDTVSGYTHGKSVKLLEDPTGRRLEEVVPQLLAAYKR